jgi:hypothetical protein
MRIYSTNCVRGLRRLDEPQQQQNMLDVIRVDERGPAGPPLVCAPCACGVLEQYFKSGSPAAALQHLLEW